MAHAAIVIRGMGGAAGGSERRLSLRLALMLVGVLAALALLGVGGVVALDIGRPGAGKGELRREAVAPVFAALPPMEVTLPDGRRLRRLQLRVVLELDRSLESERIAPGVAQVASTLSWNLSDLSVAALRGSAGTNAVKDMVRKAASHVFSAGKVRQILLQEMVLL